MSSSSSSSSFRLVSRLSAQEDSGCLVPVSKYISERTGMRLYACHVAGPVVKGYFSLATEALDDDGLPHTLEHMVFLGSEDYPYAGVLDILANKIFAAGTNAWTEVDNTTYTLATLEKHGFLQLLPIYLDHILYPLLNESGYITEVYHVNEEGEDSGVVYSEMQSVEMEDENIVERAMHRAMYPDAECGYRYETGGVLHNLRASCSHKKVVDYHKQMYRASNLAVIVAGQLDDAELIEVLAKFEEKILSKPPQTEKITRPFSRPISSLNSSVEQTVHFPSDSEANTNGIVTVNWRGPHISQTRHLIAFDLLFNYLASSSISPLQAHFVQANSYCNKIEYKVYEYIESCLGLSFTNVQLDALDKIKPELMKMLRDLVEKRTEFDMNRMESIIKMKIAEIKDKFEDSPHSSVSHLCIGDFLYGHPENEIEFKERFMQVTQFESLRGQTADFWLEFIDKYFLNSNLVTIIGKPSESLMQSISDEEKSRVEDRKKTLGKKGLNNLKRTVDNAIAQNDGEDVPDEVFDKLTVPSLENVKLKDLTQFFTYRPSQNESENFEPIKSGFKQLKSLNHLQMQVDHLNGTNFVHAVVIMDTSRLDTELREYLELFTGLLFELPIKCGDVNLTHEQVVYELNKDLLEFAASIGIEGDQFDPGCFSNYLSVYVKAPIHDYELAVKWLKLIVFHTVFDRKQIKVAVQNLLKDIKKRKHQPLDLIQSLTLDLYYKSDSNLRIGNFLQQEPFLNKILDELHTAEAENSSEPTRVEQKLELLRSKLLADKQLRFYMCADLHKLHSTKSSLDDTWLEYFPSSTSYGTVSVFGSNQPFEAVRGASFKRPLAAKNDNHHVQTPEPSRDFIVSLGSTESAYLKSVASCDIESYNHEKYPGLLVLIEYFCQTEGPLWEAVRGPGYCYSQSINISLERASIELNLDECSNLPKAYEATRKTFLKHLNDDEFDENLFESAKNSLIFLLIDDLISISNYTSYSMLCHFKGIELNETQEVIKKINKVDMNELKQLIKDYILPLFSNETSNCLIVSQPAKIDHIIKDFDKKYNRKLNLIDKIENCIKVATS